MLEAQHHPQDLPPREAIDLGEHGGRVPDDEGVGHHCRHGEHVEDLVPRADGLGTRASRARTLL